MFETLSETQRKIVFEKEGKFVVRACPGSGKTFSVAARLVHKLSKWKSRNQGIATISFTNAAWQEIEKQITDNFRVLKPIPYPHFLGTIDSFINQYIFLPFGHLVMRCHKRPTLIGEPHGFWSGRYFSETLFDNLSYDVNGNLYIIRKGTVRSNLASNTKIIQEKERLVKAGYANQEDANYFGMKTLEKYPYISKAIVHRFPILIIDEAQDTSEIQMRIIDNLINNGLDEVMLVGDPDQAIFEWHDAKPHLFLEKLEAWSDNSIILNENRRSSQKICNCTVKISSLEETSNAINDEVKNFQFIPEIVIYNSDRIKDLIEYFESLCCNYEIDMNPNNVAIIYRSKSIFNLLTGIQEITNNQAPWHEKDQICKDLAKGKYLFDNGEFKTGFLLIQNSLIKKLNNSRYCSKKDLREIVEKIGILELRKSIFEYINIMPDTSSSIGEWVDRTNKVFNDNDITIKLFIKNSRKNITFDEIFSLNNKKITEKNFKIGTIHSIKGETFEAVLVILKKKGIGKLYKTLLQENKNTNDDEELRIVYVGITRPRKLLVLAVPDDENKDVWENRILHQ